MSSSNNSIESSGYLEIIVGPMFSGKTTRLLEIYKQCKFCNIPVSIINHDIDKRYHDTLISTHDNITAPCFQTKELKTLWKHVYEENDTTKCEFNKLQNSDVILINEGQFFPDLYEVVLDMLENNKKVYISGLDGDFERKKFGKMLDLIPHCDKVTKLTSLCSICKDGTHGIFSMRLTDEKEQTIVGSENYAPVCRKCYNKNKKNVK
jgi:thymidine kinase